MNEYCVVMVFVSSILTLQLNKYKIMQVKCKICKKDLTSQAIKLLEGKIKEIKCKCKNIKL
jgi:hypothetical protein